MSELNYNRRRVEKTNYKNFKADGVEGELIHPNPLRFIKKEEKDMVTKKGKKFVAKAFIFEDVVTKERVGVQATGLLSYQMNEYRAGDVIEIEYNGKDEEDRHQTSIIECELGGGEEINPQHIKDVQDKMAETVEENGEDDAEDYV